MVETGKGGWASLFRDKIKESKYRVQGLLTPQGAERFEAARKRLVRLAKVNGLNVSKASDADVIEYLARGESNTVYYWKGKSK